MIPLLSIVIPTKNRYNCLIPVLEAFMNNIEGQNYEIIVQDNTEDNTSVLEYFQNKSDSRIKYFYTKEHLDVTQNCNKAVDNSTGKYICMIGDDDLVSPYIMKIVEMLENKNIECLTYTAGNYLWPGVQVINPNKYNSPSTMTLYNYSKTLTLKNSKEEMERVLQMGGIYFLGLPRLYHGIVKREVLSKIKEKFGGNTYFPGPSPDMAISTALYTVLDTYYYMNYPVTITGVSTTSTAGLAVRNAHVGRIEDQPFLPERTKVIWDKFIPRVWSAFTIYAESIHEVFNSVGIKTRINYFNLYAAMYQHEPATRDYIKPIAKSYCEDMGISIWQYHKACLYRLPRKVLGGFIESFKRVLRRNVAVSNMETVEDCMKYLFKNIRIN